MKTTGFPYIARAAAKLLAGWLACAGLVSIANAADTKMEWPVFNGLRWGDDVASIVSKIPALEPDLCDASEKGHYKAMGWSCEGFKREGYELAGAPFKVRLRMSDGRYELANINVARTVGLATAGQEWRARLGSQCAALEKGLSEQFGQGRRTSSALTDTAMRVMTAWQDGSTSGVWLACIQVDGEDHGDIMINMDAPSGKEAGAQEIHERKEQVVWMQ